VLRWSDKKKKKKRSVITRKRREGKKGSSCYRTFLGSPPFFSARSWGGVGGKKKKKKNDVKEGRKEKNRRRHLGILIPAIGDYYRVRGREKSLDGERKKKRREKEGKSSAWAMINPQYRSKLPEVTDQGEGKERRGGRFARWKKGRGGGEGNSPAGLFLLIGG